MRALIQRVSRAQVSVDRDIVARIGPGVLALVGVTHDDDETDIIYVADKVAHLRIFPDAAGRFAKSLLDIDGEVLVVSQFTLYAETQKGRRPSFPSAAPAEKAAPILNQLVARLRKAGLTVSTGRFGAMMDVELVNNGPVTILIDSAVRERPRRVAESD